MSMRGKILCDLAKKKKNGSSESLESGKTFSKTTTRESIQDKKQSINRQLGNLLTTKTPTVKRNLFGLKKLNNRQPEETLQQERMQAERLQEERIQASKERIKAAKLEEAKLQEERILAAKLEEERILAAKLEEERIQAAKLEERIQAAQLQKERIQTAQLQEERIQEAQLQERIQAQKMQDIGQQEQGPGSSIKQKISLIISRHSSNEDIFESQSERSPSQNRANLKFFDNFSQEKSTVPVPPKTPFFFMSSCEDTNEDQMLQEEVNSKQQEERIQPAPLQEERIQAQAEEDQLEQDMSTEELQIPKKKNTYKNPKESRALARVSQVKECTYKQKKKYFSSKLQAVLNKVDFLHSSLGRPKEYLLQLKDNIHQDGPKKSNMAGKLIVYGAGQVFEDFLKSQYNPEKHYVLKAYNSLEEFIPVPPSPSSSTAAAPSASNSSPQSNLPPSSSPQTSSSPNSTNSPPSSSSPTSANSPPSSSSLHPSSSPPSSSSLRPLSSPPQPSSSHLPSSSSKRNHPSSDSDSATPSKGPGFINETQESESEFTSGTRSYTSCFRGLQKVSKTKTKKKTVSSNTDLTKKLEKLNPVKRKSRAKIFRKRDTDSSYDSQ